MKKEIKNIEASIRARLENKARETKRFFSELLQYYGIERFLYRLSQSEYKDKFILKGALMFAVWHVEESRATMDIDFLARYDGQLAEAGKVVKDVCEVPVDPDGLVFDAETIRVERIREETEYAGVRTKFLGFLGKARIPMQVDVGFGEAVYPKPKAIDYPVILDFPKPRLKGYPAEAVVAEKFEAMVKLGSLNTRMKDFYDLWLMMRLFEFEGHDLAKAIKMTFEHRKTPLPPKPPFFATDIYRVESDRQELWSAFLKKIKVRHAPELLSETAARIEAFLEKPVIALAEKKDFNSKWKAHGPWK